MLVQYLKKFEPLIADGSKIHTMREYRVNHPAVGDSLKEFVGLRTKHCRLIRDDRKLNGWQEVRIFFNSSKASIYIDGHRLTDDAMVVLAYNDGFRGSRKSIVGNMLKHFGIQYPGQKWMGHLFHATDFRYQPELEYRALADQLFQLVIPFTNHTS